MQNVINSKYDGHIIRNLHIFKYLSKRQSLLEENITQMCARHDDSRVFIEQYQAIYCKYT